ncbi:hypothetical protein ACO22_06207, partial [Paracoccidioides brasiliensis]
IIFFFINDEIEFEYIKHLNTTTKIYQISSY